MRINATYIIGGQQNEKTWDISNVFCYSSNKKN